MNYCVGKEEKRRVVNRIYQQYGVEVQEYERLNYVQLKQIEECLHNVYQDFPMKGWLSVIRIKGRNPNEKPGETWNKSYGMTRTNFFRSIQIFLSMDEAAAYPDHFQKVVYHELIHAVCSRFEFIVLGTEKDDFHKFIIAPQILSQKSHVSFSTALADRFARQFNGNDYVDLMKPKGMKKYFREAVSGYAVYGDQYMGRKHAQWGEELIADGAARHYTQDRNEVTEQLFSVLLWADKNLDLLQKQAYDGLKKIMHAYHMDEDTLRQKYHLAQTASLRSVPLSILIDMYPRCRAYAYRNQFDVKFYLEGSPLPWKPKMTDYKVERYDFSCAVMKLYQQLFFPEFVKEEQETEGEKAYAY